MSELYDFEHDEPVGRQREYEEERSIAWGLVILALAVGLFLGYSWGAASGFDGIWEDAYATGYAQGFDDGYAFQVEMAGRARR